MLYQSKKISRKQYIVDSRENAKWLEVFEVAQKQLRDLVPNVIMKYVIAVKTIHSFWRYRNPLCSLQLDS